MECISEEKSKRVEGLGVQRAYCIVSHHVAAVSAVETKLSKYPTSWQESLKLSEHWTAGVTVIVRFSPAVFGAARVVPRGPSGRRRRVGHVSCRRRRRELWRSRAARNNAVLPAGRRVIPLKYELHLVAAEAIIWRGSVAAPRPARRHWATISTRKHIQKIHNEDNVNKDETVAQMCRFCHCDL